MTGRGDVRRWAAGALSAAALLGCTTGPSPRAAPSPTGPSSAEPTASAEHAAPTGTPTESPVVIVTPTPTPAEQRSVHDRPRWLGKRVLPRRPDGWGEVRPTPPRLRNRRFETVDLLPPPTTRRFTAEVGPVPEEVVRRSTWRPECPVGLEELRYITMSFWGFEGEPHTGEMIVHASAAEDVVEVFRRLYRARFPIEEMRVRRAGEIDAPPTGDGNNTESFDCRNATGGSSWSNHAYGLAVDINPFHNPYRKDDLIVPELAEAYVDRSWKRPGMILPGDVVTQAFADIGWGWAGAWTSLDDWQHFSHDGR